MESKWIPFREFKPFDAEFLAFPSHFFKPKDPCHFVHNPNIITSVFRWRSISEDVLPDLEKIEECPFRAQKNRDLLKDICFVLNVEWINGEIFVSGLMRPTDYDFIGFQFLVPKVFVGEFKNIKDFSEHYTEFLREFLDVFCVCFEDKSLFENRVKIASNEIMIKILSMLNEIERKEKEHGNEMGS